MQCHVVYSSLFLYIRVAAFPCNSVCLPSVVMMPNVRGGAKAVQLGL